MGTHAVEHIHSILYFLLLVRFQQGVGGVIGDYSIHSYEDFVNEIDSSALLFLLLFFSVCVCVRSGGWGYCSAFFFLFFPLLGSSSSCHPLDSMHKAEIAQVADGSDLKREWELGGILGAAADWRGFFSFPHESVDSIFDGINSARYIKRRLA